MPANEEHSVSSSRKLAAIFAADISGYSSMMSADEDGTVRKLKAVQAIVLPIIEAHGGRIIDLAGDGILAEFPSAIRAVEAALRVQNSMEVLNAEAGPEMLFRIGVNIGDVIDDGTRLFGDGINIAARLESIAEPGGILLSRAAYDQVRDRIQIAFDDLGEHSLKNIVRPVQTFRVVRESDAKPSNVRAPLGFKDSRAVAVMPFENMSSDPAETYFVDGLTEDIITALSYWRWFPVVARNSTFAYKGKPKNVTEIGRELGAAYLVEGSARRSGEHVRITVQLVETATGHHLFAERYDRAIADVFAVQDEIAERIVASIEPEIHRAEARRAARKYPSDLDAWDCSLKALSLQERMTPSVTLKRGSFWSARWNLIRHRPARGRCYPCVITMKAFSGGPRIAELRCGFHAMQPTTRSPMMTASGLHMRFGGWGGCGPSGISTPRSKVRKPQWP
jgi:TolB-like protein/class 3 adenylate cyclase